MKEFNSGEPSGGRLDWRWPFAAGCLIVLLALLWRGISKQTADGLASTNAANRREVVIASAAGPRRFRPASVSADEPTALPEQIVADKVAKFARSRRELVRRLAEHYKVEVPPEVTSFFAAIEAGRLDEAESIFSDLRQGENDSGRPRFPELGRIWRPIQETWGIADEARNWPAQKLLDYGEAVLGSLRPGMFYVGGTDPGCFIPTLLNETSDGERHIVLTQNALADSNYLDYLSFIHEGRLDTLSHGDSERAFQEYTTDARKRLEHDQQFPNEPKQVRAGEDIRIVDGKVQVSGQTSVMAINEKLFQRLLEKNPDASFAIEQSFPFKSTRKFKNSIMYI